MKISPPMWTKQWKKLKWQFDFYKENIEWVRFVYSLPLPLSGVIEVLAIQISAGLTKCKQTQPDRCLQINMHNWSINTAWQ